MNFRLSQKEFEKLSKDLCPEGKLNRKRLSYWMEQIWTQAAEEGYKSCQGNAGEAVDLELIKIAIRATEGIGEKRLQAIVDNINNLCFDGKPSQGAKLTDDDYIIVQARVTNKGLAVEDNTTEKIANLLEAQFPELQVDRVKVVKGDE